MFLDTWSLPPFILHSITARPVVFLPTGRAVPVIFTSAWQFRTSVRRGPSPAPRSPHFNPHTPRRVRLLQLTGRSALHITSPPPYTSCSAAMYKSRSCLSSASASKRSICSVKVFLFSIKCSSLTSARRIGRMNLQILLGFVFRNSRLLVHGRAAVSLF